jgi:hypothetical protein
MSNCNRKEGAIAMAERPLTWACHICGDEREDCYISVFTSDISDQFNLPHGTIQQNVRFCNDRIFCLQRAATKQLIGGDRHA